VVFLCIVGGALAAFWYLAPEEARRSLAAVKEFIQSPQVRGFTWPSKQEGQFTITYQKGAIPEDYVDAVVRIIRLTGSLLDNNLNRSYSRPIDIYIFTREGQNYFWTNGTDEIHLVFEDTNDLLPPGMGGSRDHVSKIAHILALVVAQIGTGNGDGVKPHDQAMEALANYLEMTLLVPGYWKAEGDLLWPAPYDYQRKSNREVYDRYAPDPPPDMEADRFWTPWDTIWHTVDKTVGPEGVGQVLNQACGPVGHTDVDGLAKAVESVTGKKTLGDAIRDLGR
jgi:hypothetical protein